MTFFGAKILSYHFQEMALRIFVAHGGHPTLVMHAEGAAAAQNGSPAAANTSFISRNLHPNQQIGVTPPQRASIFSSTPHRHTLAGDTAAHGSTSPYHSLADISHISFSSHGQPAVDGLRLRPSNRSRAIFTQFARIVYPVWRKRICRFRDNTVIF